MTMTTTMTRSTVLSLFLVSVVVIVVVLGGGTATATTATSTRPDRDCQTLTRGKELKQLLTTHNVLVVLQQQQQPHQPGSSTDGGENDDDTTSTSSTTTATTAPTYTTTRTYQELCRRFRDTPRYRTDDLAVVSVTDKNLQRKVWETSTTSTSSVITSTSSSKDRVSSTMMNMLSNWPFASGTMSSSRPSSSSTTAVETPAYIFYPMGESSLSGKKGIRMLPNDDDGGDSAGGDDGGDDDGDGDDGDHADAVTSFLAAQMQRPKLGNYVYSLGAYDLLASQLVVVVGNNGNGGGGGGGGNGRRGLLSPVVWVYIVGPLMPYLLDPTMAMMPYERAIAHEYLKVARKTLKDPSYIDSQIQRLGNLLKEEVQDEEDSRSKRRISDRQREQLQQRFHILKRFQDPVQVSPSEVRGFLWRISLNLITILIVVIGLPLFFFFGGVEEDNEDNVEDDNVKEDQEEEDDDEDYNEDDDKEHDDNEDASVDHNQDGHEDDDDNGKDDQDTDNKEDAIVLEKDDLHDEIDTNNILEDGMRRRRQQQTTMKE